MDLTAASTDCSLVTDEFSERAEELTVAKDDLASMKQFMEGSPLAAKWLEIKEFCRIGVDEARDLGIDLGEDLVAALAVSEDPECYKSREIPRVAGTIRRVRAQLERARDTLRADVADELKGYRASFEGSYDLGSVSQGARDEFEGIFSRAVEELGAESSTYRIRSFIESFKQMNGSRIVSLLTPPSSEPAHGDEGYDGNEGGDVAPATVPISRLTARGYAKPTISSRQDVDDYLTALRAELEEQIDGGNIIMR